MTVSENIFKWIEQNKDFFKVQAICKKVGIDKGNFSKYKTNKSIPEKYINPILDIIRPLGFTNEVKITDLTKPSNIVEPFKQPKTNYSINTTEIQNKITLLQSEKIPKERDTLLGRKVWAKEQELRILELRNQLK